MQSSDVERLLPDVFRRTLAPETDPPAGTVAPLRALLREMALMLDPIDRQLANLDECFDPLRASEPLSILLARWTDLERLFDAQLGGAVPSRSPLASGSTALRELVANAMQLSRRRGTSRGLVDFLETATGIRGFRIDEGPPDERGVARSFHIVVHVPPAAAPYGDLVRRIVEQEKPAHVTYELAPAGAAGDTP